MVERISRVRSHLARWKRSFDSNSKTRIQALEKDLEEEITKLFPDAIKIRDLKLRLAEAHKDEEIFWKQKSREQWLKEGYRYRVFFIIV